jgi:hypothetical protein
MPGDRTSDPRRNSSIGSGTVDCLGGDWAAIGRR